MNSDNEFWFWIGCITGVCFAVFGYLGYIFLMAKLGIPT